MTKISSFKNPQLLTQALTHRSYANEHPQQGQDNERLEFLGDSILKFVMGNLLYLRYPRMREGDLTRLRSRLENNRQQLAEFAWKLKLDELILLGKGAEKDGGRHNPDLLADLFEAVVGAYFLDSGIEAVNTFLESLLIPVADRLIQNNELNLNYKSKFQEWALANFGENPQYIIVDEFGLDRAKVFTAEVRVVGKRYGIGQGKNKKNAQKSAALAALQAVGENIQKGRRQERRQKDNFKVDLNYF